MYINSFFLLIQFYTIKIRKLSYENKAMKLLLLFIIVFICIKGVRGRFSYLQRVRPIKILENTDVK